jgi:hypothetical protein
VSGEVPVVDSFQDGNEISGFIKADKLSDYQFLKEDYSVQLVRL